MVTARIMIHSLLAMPLLGFANVPSFEYSSYYRGIADQSGLELKDLLHAAIEHHRQYSYGRVWESA